MPELGEGGPSPAWTGYARWLRGDCAVHTAQLGELAAGEAPLLPVSTASILSSLSPFLPACPAAAHVLEMCLIGRCDGRGAGGARARAVSGWRRSREAQRQPCALAAATAATDATAGVIIWGGT